MRGKIGRITYTYTVAVRHPRHDIYLRKARRALHLTSDDGVSDEEFGRA